MCTDAYGAASNVELKALDATANPHIALAALITAGLLVQGVLQDMHAATIHAGVGSMGRCAMPAAPA